MSVLLTRPIIQPLSHSRLTFSGSNPKPVLPDIDPESLPKRDPKPDGNGALIGVGLICLFLSLAAPFIGEITKLGKSLEQTVPAEFKPVLAEPPKTEESQSEDVIRVKGESEPAPEKSKPLSQAVIQKLLTIWLGINGALLSFIPIRLFLSKIKPEDFWRELHQHGVQGNGMTITFIDSGLRPTKHLKSERFQVFTIENQNPAYTLQKKGVVDKNWAPSISARATQPKDPVGHGTQVASVAGRSLPQAQFNMFFSVGVCSTNPKKAAQDAYENFQSFIDHPETLTLEALIDQGTDLTKKAEEIQMALKQNPDVISISLAATLSHLIHKLGSALNVSHGDKPDQYNTLARQWEQTLAPQMNLKDLEQILKPRLTPLKEALDQAAQQGVPVVISTANKGMTPPNCPEGYGYNFFTFFNHPALLPVASAKSNGQVGTFTSEGTDQNPPGIAGYGNGEVLLPSTPFKELYQSLGAKKGLASIFPGALALGKATSKLNGGTSIAAPDIAATLAMMKQVDPDIFEPGKPLEKALAILSKTATPCHLSPEDLKRLQARYPDQELTDDIIQQHIRRRVGAGLVNHNQAIAETLRRRPA